MKLLSGSGNKDKKGTTAVDMTVGFIPKLLLFFCIPLILGNLFQVLYNTVDALIVGNFVGKEALAAVGSTGPIVNIAVFSFNGVSIGAGVVIGQYFGAKKLKELHDAVSTTMAMTFFLSLVFTLLFVWAAPGMLRLMSTPDDVMRLATVYLRIYFAGISGLLVYNMGSGILRAVGDSTRPLMFLIFSSVLNIVLDLLFVIVFHMGIAGAGFATILSQFISAFMVLYLLTASKDIYRLVWKDLHFDFPILKKILEIGLPAGFQSMITSLSNTFVQAYINSFGSAAMAGWGCYTKLDQIIVLPMQSMGHSTTTFVSQNIGAAKEERANKGTLMALLIITVFNLICSFIMITCARPLIALFTEDESVIGFGSLFMSTNAWFFILSGFNHTLAGSLRGRGDSKAPMFIMLAGFVLIRQLYLFLIVRICPGRADLVGLGYPVGWLLCAVLESAYYILRYRVFRKKTDAGDLC